MIKNDSNGHFRGKSHNTKERVGRIRRQHEQGLSDLWGVKGNTNATGIQKEMKKEREKKGRRREKGRKRRGKEGAM